MQRKNENALLDYVLKMDISIFEYQKFLNAV